MAIKPGKEGRIIIGGSNEYLVTGYFYEIGKRRFRKYLNIRRSDYDSREPELMVIMMNPGSAKPIDDKTMNAEVETIPDRTQQRIAQVMASCKISYARIINLSDVCDKDSNSFYKEVIKMETEGISHSIFCNDRTVDFDLLFKNDVPVIFAWGVNESLQRLSKEAISRVSSKIQTGIQKDNIDWAFYHPLIRKKGLSWVKQISMLIQNCSTRKVDINELSNKKL